MRPLALAWLLYAALGCSASRTETVVRITNANLAIPVDIDQLSIAVTQRGMPVWSLNPTFFCPPGQKPTRLPPECLTLPVVVTLIPGRRQPHESVDVEVRATHGGNALIDDRASFRFVDGRSQIVDLVLSRSCLRTDCAHPTDGSAGAACVADGSCQLVVALPLSGDPPLDGAAAGVDLGTTDGASTCNMNGKIDNGEAGIDCGGGGCAACVESLCNFDADCATGRCVANLCTWASGPPNWLPLTPMLTPRHSFVAGVGADAVLYAAGGSDGSVPTALVDGYSFPTNTWSPAASLPTAVAEASGGVSLSGSLYVVAGLDSGGAVLGTSYTSTTFAGLSWTSVGPILMSARHNLAAVLDPQDSVWALGGQDAASKLASVEQLSRTGTAWTSGPPLLVPNTNGAGVVATGGGPSGTFFLLGGATTMAGTTDVLTHTTASAWTAVPSMNVPRESLAGVIAPDKRIYAIGGSYWDGVAPMQTVWSSVEAYSRRTRQWSPVASLGTPRRRLAAVVAPDGRIIALGGCSQHDCTGTPLNTVEAYGPVSSFPPSVSKGAVFAVSGMNFAASALVRVLINNTLAGVKSTDAAGTLSGLMVTAPGLAGVYSIDFVDERSGYPVSGLLMVN